jgi:alpha-1,2-mannosyltransferase
MPTFTAPGSRRTTVIAWVAILVIATVFTVRYASLPHRGDWAIDIATYLQAAQRLLDGRALYHPATTTGPFVPGPPGLYLYAPSFALAMVPIATLGQTLAVDLWFVLHGLLLACSCALMPVRASVRVAVMVVAALSVPAGRDIILGNVSTLVLFAAVVAWRWLDRPLGSVAVGVAITVRSTFGLFLVWWLLRRRWRAFAIAILAVACAVVVTLPFVGVDAYQDYVRTLRNISDVFSSRYNRAIDAILFRYGVDAGTAGLVLLASYLVAILAILASLRRDRELSFVVTLGATLVLSPLLWQHYAVLFLVTAAFLAQRGRPVALVLPLLMYLPEWALSPLTLAAVVIPFFAPAAAAQTAAIGVEQRTTTAPGVLISH